MLQEYPRQSWVEVLAHDGHHDIAPGSLPAFFCLLLYPLYREPSRELSEEEYIKEEKYQRVETRGIKVGYTLDKYYVPENTGMALEEASRKGEMVAKVKVYNGYSLLKEVLPIE